MPTLDTRTILLCYFLCSAICAVAVGLQWLRYRRQYSGLGFWLANYALQCSGLALIAARGLIPPAVSILVGNAALIAGFLFLNRGLGAFFGVRRRALPDIAAFCAFLAAMTGFTIASPSLSAREIVFSLAMLFSCFRGISAVVSAEPRIRLLGRSATAALAAFCVASLCRIAIDLAFPAGRDLLDAPSLDSLVLATYMCVFLSLSFALVSIVGRRMLAEREEMLEERSRAEAAHRTSEEKFNKAFSASPEAFAISRVEDGRFIEVNDSFCRLSGYDRERILGDPPIDFWRDRADRAAILEELGRSPFVRGRELHFVGSNGKSVHAEFSGGLIELEGRLYLLSIVRDLAVRDRVGAFLRLRLHLREFAASHSVEELMSEALDELESMTGSEIGFYHFVDEDLGVLTRQAWSRRTLSAFCKADGGQAHYPLADAGIWADCIRQRKAVVHNDYASSHGRRGMPEWHAPLKRELVAPTMRDGKVVAILGVGNKASDYDDEDVALVSYIVDLVWTLVERKRSDEQILALNERLAQLAMTDELTGIANRRAFFEHGRRELQKAVRYATPISFVMLDIDHFKQVNDRWGHDAGDAALKQVASAIAANVRDVDLCARLGGEEFGVLMPSTELAAASLSAERLRAAIAAARIEARGESLSVTASLGVACRSAEAQDLDAIMRAADEALYRAKASGRNRVETA